MNKYDVYVNGEKVGQVEARGRFAAQVSAEIEFGGDGEKRVEVRIVEPK